MAALSLLVLAVLSNLRRLVDTGVEAEDNRRRLEELRKTYIARLDPLAPIAASKLTLNRHNDQYYQTYLVPLEKSPNLLKNSLFSVAHGAGGHEREMRTLEERWEAIVGKLGSETVPDFLRVFWNSQNPLTRHSDLFKAIRGSVNDKAGLFGLLRDMDRDAGRIADEVIARLAGLAGSQVTVTLEVEAEIPSGAPEHVVRTVTENCRTLNDRGRSGNERGIMLATGQRFGACARIWGRAAGLSESDSTVKLKPIREGWGIALGFGRGRKVRTPQGAMPRNRRAAGRPAAGCGYTRESAPRGASTESATETQTAGARFERGSVRVKR